MREIFRKYARFLVISCTIIVVQTNSIQTSFDWKPSSDTLARYKFDSNANDSSWKWNNATRNWTASYQTLTWTRKIAYLNWSSDLNVPNFVNNVSNRTMIFFLKPEQWTGALFSKQRDWNNTALIWLWFYTASSWTKTNWTNYYVYWKTYNAWWSAVSSNMALSTTSRNCVILVWNASQLKIYVNWVLKNTWSWNYAFQNRTSFTSIRIWWRYADWSQKWNFKWYVWDYIFENKNRTDAEITTFVNKMKSKYWIS